MKRDRRVCATTALGLLLALPYPGLSFADTNSALSPGSRQAPNGAVLMAQNDQAPDENHKKRHGHEENHGGGQPPAEGHQPPQGHGQQGGQPGQRPQGHRGQQEGGEGRQPQQPAAPAQAPQRPAAPAPSAQPQHQQEPGHEQQQKRRQYKLAPQPEQSPQAQPATPQANQPPHERQKHNGRPQQQNQHEKLAPQQQNGSAPQQPQAQPNPAPSGAQAPAPSAPAQEGGHHRNEQNGAAQGQTQGQTQGRAPGQGGHRLAPQGANPTPNAAQPAQQPNTPQGGQGANGRLQLPEQNGMQQQPRPDFRGQGQQQNGRMNGSRPQNAAPVFDSQKRPFGPGGGHGGNQPQPKQPTQGAGQFGPAPNSDRAAQTGFNAGRIESIDSIHGRRIDRDQLPPRERPKGAQILKQVGNQVLIQLGTQMIVQNRQPDERITHGAREVYYEDLPENRVRETIQRPDGSRIITIRNAYGDVVRRSRILPDGQELVLVYVDDRDLQRDSDDGWRDPGEDLPPMQLTVPEDDYILDASEVRDPDRYYEFLDQPPVERVPRLYSIGEVKRSARIRDMVPRIDLDTINFDFGSAKIDQSEVGKLQAVADAIQRILKRNPAETFLIEGHTDAVGSDQSNLVLSDQRAESVAEALTNSFDIPPENLTTQGYGEQFLKVDTSGPNRQNRRVTIRRITPLVAPVASAR